MDVEQRTRVELPSQVTGTFEVYVNGVLQRPGVDFQQVGRWLVFPREIAQEGRLSWWRWASMLLGIAGTYRKHETVDVAYRVDGKRQVATGLRLEPVD